MSRINPVEQAPNPSPPNDPSCPGNVAESANGRVLEQPPVAGSEPVVPRGGPCGRARDRSGVFLKPEQLHGRESPHEQGRERRMPQKTGVVGLDVAKNKADGCIRSAGRRLSAPSTPEGEAELVA